ncbi:MAG: ATP-binding cassette domain-containing protein [Armatimonadetes bacterium]|nr:ATP-binding cassette domain-containing protein [Armatimonadota bacterium]
MSQPVQQPVLLRVTDLVVEYPGRAGGPPLRAVDGISFAIPRGRTLGLVGESGCGKSTTGRAILRLTPTARGAVTLDGRDVLALHGGGLFELRRRAQIVFQDPFSSLNPRLTVLSTLAEPLLLHRRAARREVRDRVAVLLEQVGLTPDMMHRYPSQFSGGQRQRIGIARALAVEPELLICDEPVSALDVTVQAQIVNLLRDLQEQLELTLLFIAHDLSVVRHISDEVAVMYLGRIVEHGPGDRVYETPRHPYTQALLSAVPKPDPEAPRDRILLTGDVPSPSDVPSGCRFHPRCPQVFGPCAEVDPPVVDGVACHLMGESQST